MDSVVDLFLTFFFVREKNLQNEKQEENLGYIQHSVCTASNAEHFKINIVILPEIYQKRKEKNSKTKVE